MPDGNGELISPIDSTLIVGRGAMADTVRAFDWSRTPLGPISQWPQSLRTTVQILLSSRYAMWMAWGSDLTFLHNDAYGPTLGSKSPGLGRTGARCLGGDLDDIGPRVDRYHHGNATYDEGLLLFLEQRLFPKRRTTRFPTVRWPTTRPHQWDALRRHRGNRPSDCGAACGNASGRRIGARQHPDRTEVL